MRGQNRAGQGRNSRVSRTTDGDNSKRSQKVGNGAQADWRSRFFNVFVGNLSIRVPRTALWEAFNCYGRVLDIFIQKRNTRRTTYAFVRYKEETAMWRAIRMGDRRRIDGVEISVKHAILNRSKTKANKSDMNNRAIHRSDTNNRAKQTVPLVPDKQKVRGEQKVRDERSYTEVTKRTYSGLEKGDGMKEATKKKAVESSGLTVLNLDLSGQNESSEWLDRSAIGRLKSYIQPGVLQEALGRQGVWTAVSHYGGLLVVLTFGDKEERNHYIKDYFEVLSTWFQYVEPWDQTFVCKDSFIWLTLNGVPLQLWHSSFFKTVGNLYGSYISIDESTNKRWRFDVARILVAIEDSEAIPKAVKVKAGPASFILEMQKAPAYDVIRMMTDEKLLGDQGRRTKKMSVSSSSSDEKLPSGHGRRTKKLSVSSYSFDALEWSEASPCMATSNRGVVVGNNELAEEAYMSECKGMQEGMRVRVAAGKVNMSDGQARGFANSVDGPESSKADEDESPEGDKRALEAEAELGAHNCEGYADRPQMINLYVEQNQTSRGSREPKTERVTQNIKDDAGVKNRKTQDDISRNSKGEHAVTACISREGDRERKTERANQGDEYGAKGEGEVKSSGAETEGDEFGAETEGDEYEGDEYDAEREGDGEDNKSSTGDEYGAESEGDEYDAVTEGDEDDAETEGDREDNKSSTDETEGEEYGAERKGDEYGAEIEGDEYGADTEGDVYGAETEGEKEDNKSSNGDECGTETEGDEHEEGGTKIEAGVKNRSRVVVRPQDDSSSVEQTQAILNGEDSINRGDIPVMECQEGEGDSEAVKASGKNKSLKQGSKQRRKCKYVGTDIAHYGKEREDTGYSISDSDIAHRNEIIRREMEEAMEVGAQLGLVFKEDGQVKAQELLEKNKNFKRRKA